MSKWQKKMQFHSSLIFSYHVVFRAFTMFFLSDYLCPNGGQCVYCTFTAVSLWRFLHNVHSVSTGTIARSHCSHGVLKTFVALLKMKLKKTTSTFICSRTIVTMLSWRGGKAKEPRKGKQKTEVSPPTSPGGWGMSNEQHAESIWSKCMQAAV